MRVSCVSDVGGGSGGVGGGGSFHSVPSTVLGGTVGGLEMVPLPPASAQLGAGYGATLAGTDVEQWVGRRVGERAGRVAGSWGGGAWDSGWERWLGDGSDGG